MFSGGIILDDSLRRPQNAGNDNFHHHTTHRRGGRHSERGGRAIPAIDPTRAVGIALNTAAERRRQSHALAPAVAWALPPEEEKNAN